MLKENNPLVLLNYGAIINKAQNIIINELNNIYDETFKE